MSQIHLDDFSTVLFISELTFLFDLICLVQLEKLIRSGRSAISEILETFNCFFFFFNSRLAKNSRLDYSFICTWLLVPALKISTCYALLHSSGNCLVVTPLIVTVGQNFGVAT